MKKGILVSAFSLFLLQIIYAQKASNSIKLHAGAEIPVGSFNEGYSTGWGVHATDYLEVSKGGSILLTTGLTGWNAKIGEGIKANLFIVRIGYRIFAVEGLYFQAEAPGVAIYIDENNNGTELTYGGGIGYLFNRKGKGGLDISSKFNRISGRSWISLNIGFQFSRL